MSDSWRDRAWRMLSGRPPVAAAAPLPTFTTMEKIRPPGVLWLVRSRIEQHEQQYGGRKPHHLILHTGTLRSLFTDYLREIGDTGDDMPPVENLIFAAFEGVRLYHCTCRTATARDMLVTVDGKNEDL